MTTDFKYPPGAAIDGDHLAAARRGQTDLSAIPLLLDERVSRLHPITF